MFGVLEFWLTMKSYDSNCEELIDSKAFMNVFADLRLDLSPAEIIKIFKTYENRNNFE